MDYSSAQKTEKLHFSSRVLAWLFTLALVLAFINWSNLNGLVFLNYMILVLALILNTLLFASNKFSLKTMTNLNYLLILPGIMGTIMQIVL
jgi:hypothetical protein